MGKVSNEVKKMTQEQILSFEQSGEISFLGHCLTLDDIKVILHASSLRSSFLRRDLFLADMGIEKFQFISRRYICDIV
jgi:hypothetical protein